MASLVKNMEKIKGEYSQSYSHSFPATMWLNCSCFDNSKRPTICQSFDLCLKCLLEKSDTDSLLSSTI